MLTIHQTILANLNKINTDMYRINNQISSGKQISKISENPVNLVNALGLRTNITEIAQYKENLNFGDTVISASDNALTEIKNMIIHAKTLTLQMINDDKNSQNRENSAGEIRHFLEQSVILANSQVNGKYIFGGYRTVGYTVDEPAPFIIDTRDGYLINGNEPSQMNSWLTGTVTNNAIAAGDLAVNGTATIADIASGAVTNGLNMEKAFNAKTQIEAADPNVTVNLTTLNAGAAATADTGDGTDTVITFSINGTPVNVTIPDGSNANTVATLTAAAINNVKDVTGVEAAVGDGTNGGAVDSVVFRNVMAGDNSAIAVTDYTLVSGDGVTGFGNFSQSANITHNTGQISLSSSSSFTLTSPNYADDTILTELGLAGGNLGFADEVDDGELIYGARLASGDLKINGIEVTTQADSVSTIYQDISAAAKADAINGLTSQTSVWAEVTPASRLASGAVEAGTEDAKLTGVVKNDNVINAGDLAINGTPLAQIDLSGGDPVNGLNMERATFFKAAVNAQSGLTDVTANLTTLTAGNAATTGGTANVSFTLNGVTVNVNANGTNPIQISLQIVDAINAVSDQTGVSATRGDDNNGGVSNSVVLYNSLPGDENPIVLSGLDANETLRTGLSDITQAADATHNTGKITFSSDNPFTIASPNNPNDDTILNELALDGGGNSTGISGDLADDGIIEYGSTPTYLGSGDLVINGVDIFSKTTAVKYHDSSNELIAAINAQQDQTGVTAGRDTAGRIILTAVDGRNLHIQTSALGERVTHLNGGTPQPASKVYFGTVHLLSDKQFTLSSDITPTASIETGLAALGLTGGAASTGEAGDTAGDGEILVDNIYRENGYVRYAGDRNNDIAVKVGPQSTIKVSKNGNDAVFNTGVFSVLKNLEDYLRGQNYKNVTGFAQVADTNALLNSGDTGLANEDQLIAGSFTVTVTSHDFSPAKVLSTVSIDVNPAEDTPEDIAQKINGVPGISAYWDSSGYLHVESDDPDRFSFNLTDDTTNFLDLVGLDPLNMQDSSLSGSLAELDTLLESLTNQISDFGARSNRILVQTQIYSNLELATTENLSEKEDTDLVKALMDLKGKEVAYQAALSAAAKTMQLSLVNYL